MAEQVPEVGRVLTLIERQGWSRLRERLAPDVQWSTAIEEHFHGPEQVIAHLRSGFVPGPPAYHELRDGLLVRWIDKAG